MSDDRPIRYVDKDGTVVYRASALGGCDRAFVACAKNMHALPWPDDFQAILDEGTRMEPVIREMWDAHTGMPTKGDQAEYDLRISEGVVVRCHIDGSTGDGTLREFKKFRDSTWPEFLRKGVEIHQNYPWQVAVCMWAGDFDTCEVVGGHYDKETDTITEVEYVFLNNPPIPLKAIRDKVKRIEKLIADGFDPREVDCTNAYPCPYVKVHDEKVEPDAFELPTEGEWAETQAMLVSQFAVEASNVKRLREQLDVAEKHKAEAADGLRAMVEELGADAVAAKKLMNADYVVTRVRKTTEAHMRKESTTDYFQVKVRK